ncbi:MULTISPECIES: alpha/beta hydrolase [Achromobacter]|uniref:Alpha/beta hydrolase n=1 Tax=Achromobacter spanius TaxID=217203 RepID=A0ABY8GQ38_9BURK|nr:MULTISPECIES: alpha/beta hydrolase [Achromobacter]WAI83955.1 alpha/beta hydrolase [Achromobacter spanius]WEX94036.1 alpha/beta hydrolase [Achromobacter sp. SS2-2022]WFP06802.1 alpha/beta hydrolase [Achromobacter spanius]
MSGRRWPRLRRALRILALVLLVCVVTVIGLRLYDIQQSPPLAVWHTYVPDELDRETLAHSTWQDYLAREQKIFEQVREHVSEQLERQDRVESNRYFSGAAVHPANFAHDWNRSYVLMPEGTPAGVAVLLHGLTDSPYSLRHLAVHYRQAGYAVVAIRLPGHGTVPAALTDAGWEDWLAATRLAVREGRRLVPAPLPLHIVGFSNGGALALMSAMEAIDDPSLARPDRLILISPMIGITQFARFAGLAGLPAILPAFSKAAWLNIVPEFNPFKYNSFPVNAARQSYELTNVLQDTIALRQRQGTLTALPPILTFHSVLDFTVSTRALVNALYARLPPNGSDLVLFDLNRATKLGPLFRRGVDWSLARSLPGEPCNYRLTIVTNASTESSEMVERISERCETRVTELPIGMRYPQEIYSLSHVALPFPTNDTLYGQHPDNIEEYGISLGALSIRGEVGALIGGMDSLARLTSNPFYAYLIHRVDEVIPR